VGFAFCGSFCTHKRVLDEFRHLTGEYANVVPIISEMSAATDTRFGSAEDLMAEIERMSGRKAITCICDAEPIGPKKLFDILVVAPCTGNTIAKIANGVTDTVVTMAVKAHLRNDRPVLLAISTNDALSGNAENIGRLLARKNFYFVPFRQDDPDGKPCSLAADMKQLLPAMDAALSGVQLQPLLA